MVGDHIVGSTAPSGGGNILTLSQHELGVGHTAVALITSDEPTVVGLLRVGHIVNNRADGTALGPALQIATFCGQQGRISRTVRAILSGQFEGTAGLGYPGPANQY